MPGGFGIARFHSVAVRQTLQHFVRVFQLARPPACIAEDQLRKTDDRADHRIGVSGPGDNGEIAGGRILTGNRQAVGIEEMRMNGAKLLRLCIHFFRESVHAAGVVPRETTRHVVRTLNQQCSQ